jgi:hypothetical protein
MSIVALMVTEIRVPAEGDSKRPPTIATVAGCPAFPEKEASLALGQVHHVANLMIGEIHSINHISELPNEPNLHND